MAKYWVLWETSDLPPAGQDPPALTWPLSSGPQSHLGRSHIPGNRSTAGSLISPGERVQTTHAKVQRPGEEPGQKSPGSLSIWQGRGGHCSATSPVFTSHRHAIHTWPGQWPCAQSPCPASACPASSLPHPGSGLHLSPSSRGAKPVSSSMMGEGERRAPESITGYHRVWQWPQG